MRLPEYHKFRGIACSYIVLNCPEVTNTQYLKLNYYESIYITFRRFRQNIIFFDKYWESLSAGTLECQFRLEYTEMNKFCLLDFE